jgi:Tfp pilus assembly protein PilP
MRRSVSLLIVLASVVGCSQRVDSQLKQELDQAAAQARDKRSTMILPAPQVLRSGKPPGYGAAKLPDPFYPNETKP